jgi:uncharacterized protein YndB with AHSA1/START domain
MTTVLPPDSESPATITLVVRSTIRATPERLFDAWTRPDELVRWWGPEFVICIAAEVDLRVGGGYRIANQFPDGKLLWISGEFEIVERPRRLVYTWRLESGSGPSERVTVSFEGRGECTEVSVTHERIPSAALRDQHQAGWLGCLDGLAVYLARSA